MKNKGRKVKEWNFFFLASTNEHFLLSACLKQHRKQPEGEVDAHRREKQTFSLLTCSLAKVERMKKKVAAASFRSIHLTTTPTMLWYSQWYFFSSSISIRRLRVNHLFMGANFSFSLVCSLQDDFLAVVNLLQPNNFTSVENCWTKQSQILSHCCVSWGWEV